MHTPDSIMKRCTKCGEEKPATTEWFYATTDRKSGLSASCISCKREYGRRYRTDYPDKIRERHRRYYAKNTEKVNEYQRRYYAENAEKECEYQRRYRADNPLAVRASEQRRRSRIISADGTHTADDIRLQLKSQTDKRGNLRCWWCGKPIKANGYHVDHRVPLARGGSNTPENLCISCPTCNKSKGAKLPQEWNGRLL
jgi:5-methylcytosine-specific restriction endonuclease McrA